MPETGTRIEVNLPKDISGPIQGENIPLSILYEDDHLLFVEKIAGMLTHPTSVQKTGTLLNALFHHCPGLLKNKLERPGIVHRLDKGTSGVMVVAKTEDCHQKLVQLFSRHDIERIYQALIVGGDIPPAGVLESSVGRNPQKRLKMKTGVKEGKHAITHYKKRTNFGLLFHLECLLETGRTHQIRVQLSELLRTPVLCDATYGNPPQQLQRLGPPFQKLLGNYPHPLLHAEILGLVHPISGKKLKFKSPLPEIFTKALALAKEHLSPGQFTK